MTNRNIQRWEISVSWVGQSTRWGTPFAPRGGATIPGLNPCQDGLWHLFLGEMSMYKRAFVWFCPKIGATECPFECGGGVQWLFGQCPNELLYFYGGASPSLQQQSTCENCENLAILNWHCWKCLCERCVYVDIYESVDPIPVPIS